MRLSGFFYCECGKLHMAAMLSEISVCTCGINLYNKYVLTHAIHNSLVVVRYL